MKQIVWNHLSRHRAQFLLAAGFASSYLSAANYLSSKTTKLEGNIHYWHHEKKDFDLYITNPTANDLPLLLREFQAGKEVWPWIWCHPNENGPHHVFVVTDDLTDEILEQIHQLLKNSTNNNVLVVTSKDQLKSPGGVPSMCGIVTGAQVTLLNTRDKILMLNDERVIAFDRLVVA
jgi:hypothetical protein